jgi:uncharacterized protein (TIGR02996 family)
MTHDDAFIQGIRERPDDDAPRLIYADWLDEHGDPQQGEFIRVECEMARLKVPEDRSGYEEECPRWQELNRRGGGLTQASPQRWCGALGEFAYFSETSRGFVEWLHSITLA